MRSASMHTEYLIIPLYVKRAALARSTRQDILYTRVRADVRHITSVKP